MAILKDLIVNGAARILGDTYAGKITATSFVKNGGTSSQFLKADGSVDTNTYLTSATDTKNTAGSTDTSSKIFIIGATSQAANPQTYSHDTAYVGTDGCLYSGGTKVLTANQSISFDPASGGDVTGTASGTTSIAPTLTIGNGKVTTAKIADANVTTAKIKDANVTNVKLANSTIKIAGNSIALGEELSAATLMTSLGVSSPMVFKGTLGTNGTITTLPAAATTNTGFTYKVITAGTYQGVAAKVGDVLVSNGSSWILIPSGDEPSGTVTSVGAKINGSNVGTAVTTSGVIDLGTLMQYSTSTADLTSTAEDSHMYNFSGTNPVTNTTEYGSFVSLPGSYGADLLLSGASGASPHMYIRRRTSTPSLTSWYTVLDSNNASSIIKNVNGSTTITSSTGTSQITLAASTKYSINAGGSSYIFTTPPNTTYSAATTSAAGLMSATDKTKLDGIAAGANNYAHPTGDGNLHVPATGTSNNGKVLTAGSTAGSISWTALPTSLPANGGNADTVDNKHASDFATSGHTHTTSLVSGGTATVNLSANTAYTLTAGGTSVIFKTPADNNTDTKNTSGSTDTSSKIFIIGATSQAANPQTYSHDTAYVGTDGCLYSGSSKVYAQNTSLSGYAKASSYSAVTTSDTINTALGKLSAAVDGIEALLAAI